MVASTMMNSLPTHSTGVIAGKASVVSLKRLVYLCCAIAASFIVVAYFELTPLGGQDDNHRQLQEVIEYYVERSDSSENVLPSGFPNAKYEIDKSKQYGMCAVGAGLSGTVFAERTANVLKKNVLVIDSRPHIGGNCYDFWDQKTGILRNQYGSHLFHTNIKRVWDYVTSNPNAPKWRRWYHYKFGRVISESNPNGTYVPIPPNIMTVNRLLNLDIQTPEEMDEWLKTVQIPCPESGCENAEQMAKSRVGEDLYKLIFEGYTLKQWEKHPSELKASVTARIPVVSSFDPRYFSDKWQSLPGDGYTAWFAAMLDHPLIDVVLNTDFFDHKSHLEEVCEKIIYTGPIDRYFEKEGMEKLEYRGIKFTEERHYNHPGYLLPTPVLNLPGLETNYTRAIEYKQYLHRPSKHTLVVWEESYSAGAEGDPYYPVPTQRNQELYAKYQKLAAELEETGGIQFVGRLANYKYYNMDQAIDNALTMFYTGLEPKGEALEQKIEALKVSRKKFMETEFQSYKQSINTSMKATYQKKMTDEIEDECEGQLWTGEFGMELRVMVPWAHYKFQNCSAISTKGVAGSRYLYFFSGNHVIVPDRRSNQHLPDGNPFDSDSVHMPELPDEMEWDPPPYKEFFARPEIMKSILVNDKPLVVILNKYGIEWKKEPINFMSREVLMQILDYLTPNYTILYKRHTDKRVGDHQDRRGSKEDLDDLDEKDMIRRRYPEVLLFEDFADNLDDVEDYNLLLFAFMSLSEKFLTVQGGTAVTGSYFGGTNIILIKKGREIKYGDYGYFHRFSGADIKQTTTDEDFVSLVKKIM